MSQPAPDFQVIVTLLALVNEQQEQVARLSEQVVKLEAENKELADRLNTNSRNSSKPPSTDGYAKPSAKTKKSSATASDADPKDDKPSPKSLRQKSGLKPGGQKGHKGSTLEPTAEPERTQYHPVIDCEKCHRSLRATEPLKRVERQVFEPGRSGRSHLALTALS